MERVNEAKKRTIPKTVRFFRENALTAGRKYGLICTAVLTSKFCRTKPWREEAWK